MGDLSKKAALLHSGMMEAPPSKVFDQEELKNLVKVEEVSELLVFAQELIDHKLVKLVRQGDELKFQAVSKSEAEKVTSMSDDEAMIYSHIEASGREGIWTKTLKAKTNLHQHVVARCLKSLENQRYIKSIKSVKHPTRKIYMLYNLQPSIELTGGPWFTDSELDTEFIDSLVTVIWRYVASKTFPAAFQSPQPNTNVVQSSFPSNYTGFVNLESIMDFISSNNIINVDLQLGNIRSLCEVLVFDDKLELVNHTTDVYKATWQSILEAGFGTPYKDESGSHLISQDMKNLLRPKHFSIFDNYSPFNETDPNDVAYLDAWVLH